MADDLENTIRDNAAQPKQASADGVSTQQHPLPDVVEADKHLAGKDAFSRNPAKAFVRIKIVSPGTA